MMMERAAWTPPSNKAPCKSLRANHFIFLMETRWPFFSFFFCFKCWSFSWSDTDWEFFRLCNLSHEVLAASFHVSYVGFGLKQSTHAYMRMCAHMRVRSQRYSRSPHPKRQDLFKSKKAPTSKYWILMIQPLVNENTTLANETIDCNCLSSVIQWSISFINVWWVFCFFILGTFYAALTSGSLKTKQYLLGNFNVTKEFHE